MMRDYDPTLGRYIESDPLGQMGGLNLYGYANQNPVLYTDSRGEVVQILVPAAVVSLPVVMGAYYYYILRPIDYNHISIFPSNEIDDKSKPYNYCQPSQTWKKQFGLEPDHEERCEQGLLRDLATCQALGKRDGKSAFKICEQQAMLRYSNCLSGRDEGINAPLPPWGTK